MSDHENTDLFRVTRRDFLRGAAVVAGGASAGSWLGAGAADADAALAVAAGVTAGDERRRCSPGA